MRGLSRASLSSLAADWGLRLRAEEKRFPASEIYGGRGFLEATSAAGVLDAKLMVVSAGLGLIYASERIPAYACTILLDAPDSVAGRVEEGFTAPGWWAALVGVSPFRVSLRKAAGDGDGLILAALSDAYIEMIAGELLALPERILERLRIFTRAPIERVPTRMRPFVMPYDDRLDGPDSNMQGTLSDFASRALHHFAKEIVSPIDRRSATKHASAVSAALEGWRLPVKVKRVRYDDAAILKLIRANWDDPRGRSLRRFRDEFNVACEQRRFRALADVVRAERG